MTREEIREIVEASIQANFAMGGDVVKAMEDFAERMQTASGLRFVVEATELRTMLRKQAANLRADADKIETEIALEEVPEGIHPQQIEMAKRLAASKIRGKRQNADRLDWCAARLQEKTYNLSTHEISSFLPEYADIEFRPY